MDNHRGGFDCRCKPAYTGRICQYKVITRTESVRVMFDRVLYNDEKYVVGKVFEAQPVQPEVDDDLVVQQPGQHGVTVMFGICNNQRKKLVSIATITLTYQCTENLPEEMPAFLRSIDQRLTGPFTRLAPHYKCDVQMTKGLFAQANIEKENEVEEKVVELKIPPEVEDNADLDALWGSENAILTGIEEDGVVKTPKEESFPMGKLIGIVAAAVAVSGCSGLGFFLFRRKQKKKQAEQEEDDLDLPMAYG